MNLFQQTSVKAYLKAWIASLPKNGRGEVTRIAASLGVSTTLVSHVLAGSKTFTPEQLQLLIDHLGLSGLEADYLTYLGQYERSGTERLKKVWRSKLEEIRERSLRIASRVVTDRALTDQERAIFYSSPLYSSVRIFTSLGEGGKTLAEVCERFELTAARATRILDFLVSAGLCKIENGRYGVGAQKTHLEQGSPYLLRHHSNWRLRAISRGEDLGERELMYTAPVSLSQSDFDLLREEMVLFIKRFLERVHASPAEEIACFNMDFFFVKK